MMPSNRLNSKPKTAKVPAQPVHHFAFEAIGTQWWIGIYQALADDALGSLQRSINHRIEQFDQTYSRFRADSLVTQISRQAGIYHLPPDSRPLLELYRQLYESTGGLVTPLIGQTLSDAGYDAHYSFQPKDLTPPPRWDDVMAYADCTLTTTRPLLLDFGAAGKGYLVDLLGIVLSKHGVQHFCIDASGDIYCQGLDTPLTIGLENPDASDEVIGTIAVRNNALCGSATNRRAWKSYHHILDPQTLTPVQRVRATWVLSKSTLLADGLATALFFVEPHLLQQSYQFDYCVLGGDGSAQYSHPFTLFN
jgi:FAD:protein FMN transferase